jgi:hypothetical protein
VVKEEKVGLLANSNIVLNRWKNYFSQLLNVLYMGLVVLGSWKYVWLRHDYLSIILLRF